jgi:hypothetical protein
MDALWWGVAILFTAILSGGLVYLLMEARMEVALARQREELAGAKARLDAKREELEGSLKNVEEATRRKAMDEFMSDIRIEERHYTRQHKMFFLTRKLLVRQERIFFRNIPLSDWIEHEMPIEEGADAEKMAQTMSVFAAATAAMIEEAEPKPIRRLLR